MNTTELMLQGEEGGKFGLGVVTRVYRSYDYLTN